MASTVEAQRLTDLHRREQTQVSQATALLMLRLFGVLDPQNPDAKVEEWLRLVIPVLRQQRALSAALAARYIRAFRRLEVPEAVEDFIPEPRTELPLEKVIPSLMVTGPVELRRIIRQKQEFARESKPVPDSEREWMGRLSPADIEKTAVKVAGAAIRHVRDGGRETTYAAAQADPRALGYMRVSDGDPCYFCAMLVSRGPIYREDSFADSDPRFHGPGEHKVHDSCGCDIEPVYTRAQRPEALQDYANAVWMNVTREGAGGKEAIKRFRRQWESRV